jgi:uncharacterized membrane protein
MSRPKLLIRRVELVEAMRRPAPAGYQLEPQNRQQRRQAARAARREAVKRGSR